MNALVAEVPALSAAVVDWLDGAPADVRTRVERLRGLLHEVAVEVDAGQLVEEMKWGQPSFRSARGRESTPVRLDWTGDGDVLVLVHCQTSVIADFAATAGDRYRFDGTRAVVFGADDEVIDEDLVALFTHALTYRR